MLPWSLWAENIFSVFEVRNYPSIYDFGLEVSPLKCDLGSQASPLQHELGSGSSRYRRYVSRMTRTENFLSQNFSKFFWKPLFSTIHHSCYPDHYAWAEIIFFELVRNENFDYVINENCPICITKIGKKWKFWLRNQRPNPPPPPPPVITRKHLETPPPSADYVICERPLVAWPRVMIFVWWSLNSESCQFFLSLWLFFIES